MRRHGAVALALLLLGLAGAVQAATSFAGTVSYVSDGDTLWVKPEDGGPPRKLRIDGIDAPEICQAGGPASRAALSALALHRRVDVEWRREDDYGRGLTRIRLAGADLGAAMVRSGQAWSHRWRHNPGPYAEEETAARRARRGLFADPGAELPRAFRKRHGSCHVGQG